MYRSLADPCSFHTFLNHSRRVWHTCSQLDHLGIVLVIWGSTVTSTYFGFYCDAVLRNRYFLLASVTGAASCWATFQKWFQTPAGRKLRSLAYALLGLSAFVSAAHGCYLNGWTEQNKRQSLSYFIGLGALNGLGTLIYATRIPERLSPETFDIVGSSHQIMHVMVMLGAYSHSIGLHRASLYWDEQSTPSCT